MICVRNYSLVLCIVSCNWINQASRNSSWRCGSLLDVAIKDSPPRLLLNSNFLISQSSITSIFIWQIILKYCIEHGSVTAVLCAIFQNNSTTEKISYRSINFHKMCVSGHLLYCKSTLVLHRMLVIQCCRKSRGNIMVTEGIFSRQNTTVCGDTSLTATGLAVLLFR